MIFNGIKSMLDTLILPAQPGCAECKEERGVEVAMEMSEEWVPRLAAEVTVWECPECGHTTGCNAGDGTPPMDTPRFANDGGDDWTPIRARRGSRDRGDRRRR